MLARWTWPCPPRKWRMMRLGPGMAIFPVPRATGRHPLVTADARAPARLCGQGARVPRPGPAPRYLALRPPYSGATLVPLHG